MTAGAVLAAHEVDKTFAARGLRSETVRAVRGVSLRIDEGATVALLGPNGAGKTTLLDMICGLTQPSAGTLRVLGGPPKQAVARGAVAAVLQSGGLLPDLTVGETVRLFADLHRNRARADAVIAELGLTELRRRRVGACSGGEQQRLRVALALIPEPRFLILDEPTTGMDLGSRQEFWGRMRERMAAGSTLLYATHHLDEVEGIADRVVLMARGAVLADGTVAEVRRTVGVRILRGRLGPDAGAPDAVRAQIAGLEGVTRVVPVGERLVEVVAGPAAMDAIVATVLGRGLLGDVTVEDASLEAGLDRLLADGDAR